MGVRPYRSNWVGIQGSACVPHAVFGVPPDTSLSGRAARDAPPGDRDGRAPRAIFPKKPPLGQNITVTQRYPPILNRPHPTLRNQSQTTFHQMVARCEVGTN